MKRLHLNLHEAVSPQAGGGQFEWQIANGLWHLGRYKIDAVAHRINVSGLPFEVRRGFFPKRYFFHPCSWHKWCPFSYNTLVGDFRSDVSMFFSNTMPELRIRGKTIAMIYDLIPFRVPDLLRNQYSEAFLANYCRQHEYLASHADKVVTISEYSRRDISQQFGIAESDISVVPCGVNAPRFASLAGGDTPEKEVKAKYGLPDRFVLYFGTTATYKNVANLIRGYARMSAVVRGNVALVVTHGNEELERVARDEGVANRVKFLGYVQETDKPSLYRLASAYGFLSRIEGFGLTPLEAMAAGVPTVVSNCATLPEVVGDGALVVGPDDIDGIAAAFERMLEDGELRSKLIVKGRRRAGQFTWNDAVLKMADVIDNVI